MAKNEILLLIILALAGCQSSEPASQQPTLDRMTSQTPFYMPSNPLPPTETLPPAQTPNPLFTDKGPGTYLVGVDIGPGVWRNNGTSDSCLWEITTRKGDIIDKFTGMGGGSIYIPINAYQVELDQECGSWTYLTGE